jgi:hypothetical protein
MRFDPNSRAANSVHRQPSARRVMRRVAEPAGRDRHLIPVSRNPADEVAVQGAGGFRIAVSVRRAGRRAPSTR